MEKGCCGCHTNVLLKTKTKTNKHKTNQKNQPNKKQLTIKVNTRVGEGVQTTNSYNFMSV